MPKQKDSSKSPPSKKPPLRKYAVVFAKTARVEVDTPNARKARDSGLLALKDEDFETAVLVEIERVPQPGTRVRAVSGDGKRNLGEGTFEGFVELRFARLPDGSVKSTKTPEVSVPDLARLPEGTKIETNKGNAKIALDSGETVYGCQIWWQPIWPDEDKEEPLDDGRAPS